MRYENITLQNLEFVDEDQANYECLSTEELIDITNNIRKEKGYNDIVSTRLDNEVYYNFYLTFSFSKKKLELIATCNNSELDDWATYVLPMTPKEKEMLLFKVIETSINEPR